MLQVAVGLMWGAMGRNKTFDRIFNAPGDLVWTDPWVAYLKSKGVIFKMNAFVTNINHDPYTKKVKGLTWCGVLDGKCHVEGDADAYLIAVPSERFTVLADNSTSLYEVDPKLKTIASKPQIL